eukprot:m.22307 g.22307  ORF g.22307 m.22307 type:complete len:216 (-) comp11229_c0_seq1:64-711(-)
MVEAAAVFLCDLTRLRSHLETPVMALVAATVVERNHSALILDDGTAAVKCMSTSAVNPSLSSFESGDVVEALLWPVDGSADWSITSVAKARDAQAECQHWHAAINYRCQQLFQHLYPNHKPDLAALRADSPEDDFMSPPTAPPAYDLPLTQTQEPISLTGQAVEEHIRQVPSGCSVTDLATTFQATLNEDQLLQLLETLMKNGAVYKSEGRYFAL